MDYEHYELFEFILCIHVQEEFNQVITEEEAKEIIYAIASGALSEHLLNHHGINATNEQLDAIAMLF